MIAETRYGFNRPDREARIITLDAEPVSFFSNFGRQQLVPRPNAILRVRQIRRANPKDQRNNIFIETRWKMPIMT
jgi:hypothetical protein